MRKMIAAVVIAASAMALAPMAQAQQQFKCPPGNAQCTEQNRQPKGHSQQGQQQQGHKPDQHRQQQAQNQKPKAQQQQHAGRPGQKPRVGDSARHGSPFHQAQNSRFPKPGPGREYRVIDGNLVLVDSQTLAVVAVVGLLAGLLNQ